MNLRNIILSKGSQTQKGACCMVHFCHILEVANLMYSQEAHQWLPEVGNASWD